MRACIAWGRTLEPRLAHYGWDSSILDDAIHAFTTLGGLERFHLTEVAGDLPLASIEDVAAEIVQSSRREEEVFEELARELGQSDESPPADEDE